jgi:hypothetical protein
MPLSFPARPLANTDQDENAKTSIIESKEANHYTRSKSSSTLRKSSNASVGSGSIYSDIVARAIALKSSGASDKSSGSFKSVSTSSSYRRRMQQSLALGGGGQHAGIKTTESYPSIHRVGTNSAALIAPTFTPVLASEDIIIFDSQHQIQQGSGESPLENINHNMNDDLSSMSSVVSRAENTSRDFPIAASPTRSGVDMSASSRISSSSAQNPREENVGKRTQHRLTSESPELCGGADKESKHVTMGSHTVNALRSEDNEENQTSIMGIITSSRLSMKSGDDISFAYEDFPAKRPNNSRSTPLQTLPTYLETDSWKPWKTAPRETSVDRSSNCDSQSSRKLKLQQPSVESRSDESAELFESLALKRMGLYEETSVSDKDKDEESQSTVGSRKLNLEQDKIFQHLLVDRSSDGSVELFEASLKRMGLYEEMSVSDKDESCHPTDDEQPDVLKSSQYDIGITEIENTDEHDDRSGKITKSSPKDFAAAAQEMADLLQKSNRTKQLRMSDDSSSYSSERSETSIINEMKSSRKSFVAKKNGGSLCSGGKENASDNGDSFQRSATELKPSLDSEHHESDNESLGIKISVDDISLVKSLDEESQESEHDINVLLQSFRKRGSATFGDPILFTSDQIFQHDEIMDTISISSSPLSIEHANDEDNARSNNHRAARTKSICSQQRVNCQKSKFCCVTVVVVVVAITIVIGIAVSQLTKKPSTKPSHLEPKPPTSPPTLQPQNWMQVAGDLAGKSSGDEAGFSVSASDDGNRVIIGARRNQKDDMKNRGAARIYQLDDETGSYVPIWDLYGEAAGDVSLVHESMRIFADFFSCKFSPVLSI